MTMFPLNPEPAFTNEQLALLIKKYPQFDPVYLNVHMRDDWIKVKELLDGEWKEFKPFADSNFLGEFQNNFSQRAWEIYLFHLLRTNQFRLLVPRKNKSSPDFKIDLMDKNLFIEATVAGKGKGINKVETTSDMLSSVPSGTIITRGGHIDDSNHPKVRRILNSLDMKMKQYHQQHKAIIDQKDLYVIAVNGGSIDGHLTAEALILEATAGVNPALHLPRKADGTFGPAYQTIRDKIPNSGGNSDIDLGIFSQDNFNEIGVIMYFGSDVYNAILQNLSNELIVVHNPNAVENKKIDLKVFSCFRQLVKIPEGWKRIEPSV